MVWYDITLSLTDTHHYNARFSQAGNYSREQQRIKDVFLLISIHYQNTNSRCQFIDNLSIFYCLGMIMLSNCQVFSLWIITSFYSLTLQQQNCHAEGGLVIRLITSLLANKRRTCSHASIKHQPSSTVHPFLPCMLQGCLWLVSNETLTNRFSFESFLGYLWCEWILWEKSRRAI